MLKFVCDVRERQGGSGAFMAFCTAESAARAQSGIEALYPNHKVAAIYQKVDVPCCGNPRCKALSS